MNIGLQKATIFYQKFIKKTEIRNQYTILKPSIQAVNNMPSKKLYYPTVHMQYSLGKLFNFSERKTHHV